MKKQLTSEELKLKLSAILDDEVERVIFFGQIDNPSDRSEQLSDGFRNVSITLKKDFVMQDLKTLEVFFYGCHAVISQERMYAEHMSSDPRDFILGELGNFADGATLPELVSVARTKGLTESATRSAALRMIDGGQLELDLQMRVRRPSTADSK